MKQTNINKLVCEALLIEEEEAQKAGALGFMPRALVQVTLPHRKFTGNEFTRMNGNFSISIMSPARIGLPYGSIPRLLLAWIATEAVKMKSSTLYFGDSLADFMQKLDLGRRGGVRGDITRLKEQMNRLFSSSVTCVYKDKTSFDSYGFHIVERSHMWWEPKNFEQIGEDSFIVLNKTFFDTLIGAPVPIDFRVLKAIKQSSLAIDIYCWLTYRMSYLKKQTMIPWETLQKQFGADYADDQHGKRNFKQAFIRELKKTQLMYSAVKVICELDYLVLEPSKTHIVKKSPSLTLIQSRCG